jgi:ABC-type glutathione transport system ATPase component
VSPEPPASPALVFEAVGVTKSYRARGRTKESVTALRDLSLTVGASETLGIVGESGSGKSTLARLLLALEPPTSGTIRYRGEVISGRKERDLREFRRRVQIVFQDPMSSLDPRMKVHDLLAEPLRALHIEVDEGERVRELLASVELPVGAADRYAHQFSGGQRQRIAIARALGPSPEVLVADEPVSALDVSVRAQILNLLAGLVDHFDLTLILISHDMAVVRHLCRRVAVLYRGDLVETGETEALYRHPRADYTRELLAAAPRIRPRRAGGGAPGGAGAVDGGGVGF